jgi:predicted ester cyclase
MSEPVRNKGIVRSCFRALNDRDIAGALRFVARDFRDHGAAPAEQGADGMRSLVGRLLAAVPDLRWSCDVLVAEGDRVCFLTRMTGTHLERLPPATPQLLISGSCPAEQLHFVHVAGGRLVEHWNVTDYVAMWAVPPAR